MSFIEVKTPSEDHTEGKWKGICEQIFFLVAASGLSPFPSSGPSVERIQVHQWSEKWEKQWSCRGQTCGVTNFVFSRSESWILKRPNIVSKKPKSAYQIPDLKGTLQVFKGKENQRKGVGVKLL